MAKIEVSLTRAHKIAERLKQLATEALNEAKRFAAPVILQGVVSEAQIERLREQGRAVRLHTARAERLTLAAANVRTVIGIQNSARGIGELMATLDAVNRILCHKKELQGYAKSVGVQVSELTPNAVVADNTGYGSHMVTVSILESGDRQVLDTEIAALQKKAFSLSDRIAEANATRVAIELDDDLADEVTGA